MSARDDGGPASKKTLRDEIAIAAMQALIHSGATIQLHRDDGVLCLPARVGIPPLAYEYADAMLKARKQP